jgi:IMP dehydrogenase
MFSPTYCFDDILIEPNISSIKSRKDINLNTNIGSNGRELILKKPIISSPMDTVSESNMAIALAKLGGISIIHRFMPIEKQVNEIEKVKRFINYIYRKPYKLDKTTKIIDAIKYIEDVKVNTICVMDGEQFYGLITNRDILSMNNIDYYSTLDENIITKYDNTIKIFKNDNEINDLNNKNLNEIILNAFDLMNKNRIEKIPIIDEATRKLQGIITRKSVIHYFNNTEKACLDKVGRLCVGACVGIQPGYMDDVAKLVKAGADLICVDTANGHNINTINTCKDIRGKYPNLIIMAGNVCSSNGFEELAKSDIDCIRLGIGNGSICTTRLETGVGNCQFSNIYECFNSKITNNLDTKIICDGGSLGKTGNKFKALCAGANAIMVGKTLAGTEESPGEIIIRNGKKVKYFRGMASAMATLSKQEKMNKNSKVSSVEGVDGDVPFKGPISSIIDNINDGLRSGMSYLGSKNMNELHILRKENKIKFRLCTSIGLTETNIRIKTY